MATERAHGDWQHSGPLWARSVSVPLGAQLQEAWLVVGTVNE